MSAPPAADAPPRDEERPPTWAILAAAIALACAILALERLGVTIR